MAGRGKTWKKVLSQFPPLYITAHGVFKERDNDIFHFLVKGRKLRKCRRGHRRKKVNAATFVITSVVEKEKSRHEENNAGQLD